MNEEHDPNVTTDHIIAVPAESLRTTDHVPASASTAGSHPRAEASADDLPVVPGYRVLRVIARGGMGRVLAAYDLTLDRDVALKILLPGANADRFVRESKITARLPHPGIPPVHALGTLADGSPFLAMKLIAGRTLADEMKTADRPRLLQAFTQVCQAVGFAHSRGIVHRDLKPANVMVGAFGEVQVMDWGLAKDLAGREARGESPPAEAPPAPVAGTDAGATTAPHAAGTSTEERTQAGAIMGTPAYMAPEQARGEAADARSDVFALGGILCALLTGQPPFVGKSTIEVIQRAGAAELGEANARLDRCGADAELVALCRRCLSPQPEDRFVDGQAVAEEMTAYLDGVQDRLRKAELAEAEARARATGEAKRRRLTLALAAAVVAMLLGGGGVVWWRSAQAQERRAFDARNGEAVAVLLNQCEEALKAGDAAKAHVALEAARKRFDEGGAEQQAQRLTQADADLALLRDLLDLDQARWTVVDNALMDPAAFCVRARKALRRFDPGAETVSVDEAAARVSASTVRERIVSVLDQLLELQPSAQVRALLQRVDADPFRDTVRDAIMAQRRNAKLVELFYQKDALEQPPAFIALLDRLLDIDMERRRQLLQAALIRRPAELALLMAMGNCCDWKRKESADHRLRWYQAAVAAAPDNSAAYNNLGNALRDKGQTDDALACYERAIALAPRNAVPHNAMGSALYREGKVDRAIEYLRKATDLDPNYASAHNNLGVVLRSQGKFDEAIACHEKAIALDPKNAAARSNLGSALAKKGRGDEAIKYHLKAIELDPNKAIVHFNLGNTLQIQGKSAEAIPYLQKAIELDPSYPEPCTTMGDALAAQRKLDEAIAYYHKAIKIDPKHTSAYNNLGNALKGQGKLREATECYETALKEDPKNAKAHYNLGLLLHRNERLDEAIEHYKSAIEIDPAYQKAYAELGVAMLDKGQPDESIRLLQKAVTLDPKDFLAHRPLGEALMRVGRYDDAKESFQRALALVPKQDPRRNLLPAEIELCTRLAKVAPRLPRLISGEEKPASAQEAMDAGLLCWHRNLTHAAVRLRAAAFALDPKMADDLNAGHRYSAACEAALAAAGQGKDVSDLSDKERARLRQQALDWLRADLAAHGKRLESAGAAARNEVQRALRQWLADSDVVGIRDKSALAKLPPDEQKAFTQLWADVAALLKKAGADAK
jgi:tetratricopeptide (TPR) repeat protein